MTSEEISAESVKDIFDVVVDVSTYSAWMDNRFPLSRNDIESLLSTVQAGGRRHSLANTLLVEMTEWRSLLAELPVKGAVERRECC